MVVIDKEFVAIPKKRWLKIQKNINLSNLSEDEKIEFWTLDFDELTLEQKEYFFEAKKMDDSKFVNL